MEKLVTREQGGTVLFMSPERVLSDEDGRTSVSTNGDSYGGGGAYGFPADVWAFGMTLIALVAPNLLPKEYWDVVAFQRGTPPPALPKTFSSSAQDFVRRCLVVVPSQRATADALLDHPFINEARQWVGVFNGTEGGGSALRPSSRLSKDSSSVKVPESLVVWRRNLSSFSGAFTDEDLEDVQILAEHAVDTVLSDHSLK